MLIARILGRPNLTTLYNALSARYNETLNRTVLDTNSALRQHDILTNYYRMCDVDERHQVVQAYKKKFTREWLHKYHMKQDVENRMLEAGLLKCGSK